MSEMDPRLREHDAARVSRRAFLGTAAVAAFSAAAARAAGSSYEDHVSGIRIHPGKWRPHYPWEHIAWISPPWPSQDYLWLDFPEAIFTSQGLIYLSHVNPPIDTVYDALPPVPWTVHDDGISFERTLPSGIVFGGRLRRASESVVDMSLHLKNNSPEPLKRISLQTCAFLRGIAEWGDYTADNKFVHVPERGWVPIADAFSMESEDQLYRVGWRHSGTAVADVPMAVTVSNQAERLFAMTWLDHTLSMVSNPRHPCAHADPWFPDLEPGESGAIAGKLVFFEGKLDDFDHERHIAK